MNRLEDVSLFSEQALAGRTIVITGAGRGLGRSMATALAHVGADLVLVARHTEEINETASAIKRLGAGKILTVRADVTSVSDINNLVERSMAEFGKIDVLVNNAGLNGGHVRHNFEDIPTDQWMNMLNTNVTSVFLVTQAVGRVMLERGAGKVINIASVRAVRSVSQGLCYSVSKAAVIQMTRALALEWGKRGVTVNCLAPGSLDLHPGSNDADHAKLNEERERHIPMGHVGRLEDACGALIYLASSASDYVNGATLFVDGGISAG